MTSGQKTAFSLLATMILYTAFVLVANTKLNLFDNLEKQYYSQAKVKEKVEQLDKLSTSYDSYITNVLKTIEEDEASYLKSDAVISYLDYYPSEKLIEQRRLKTTQLFNDLPGLDGLRIVDKDGRYIHYSSYEQTDLTNKDSNKKIYDRYNSVADKYGEIPFDSIAPREQNPETRISVDAAKKRLIVAFPVYKNEVYSAVLLTYFNFDEMQKSFESSEDYLHLESLNLLGDKTYTGGIVVGIPPKDVSAFEEPVVNYWKSKALDADAKYNLPEKILQIDDGRYYEILSSPKAKYLKVSGVYTNDIFELSNEIKLLIYIGVGISLFLLIFLIFSFRGDGVVTLKKRIRRIQYGVINEYLTNKEEIEWDKVVGQIKVRQNELSKEILKAAHVSKRREKELDEVLSKSWEEIFAVIEPKVEQKKAEVKKSEGVSKEELRQMLEEVLKETKLNVNVANVASVAANGGATSPKAAPAKPVAKKPVPAPVEEVEEIEEIDEIEEVEELADDVEEIEEVEELADDVEEIEEVEELADDVEEIEEVEELADDVEEIEEVEELADDVEEIEEVEELADDVEEIEEVEELADDVEEIEEVEELADDVEEIEEVEELADDVEEIEEVEELADDVEEIEEVEELADDVEEIEEVEELADDVEEIEEVEELADDVEEIEEVEEVEEVADDVEEIEEVEELADDVEEIEEVEEVADDVEEIEEVEELADDVEEIDEVEELADDVEEIEEVEDIEEIEESEDLEEVEELETVEDPEHDLKLIKALSGTIQYEYKDSIDTFINLIKRFEYPTVDNLFAEELCLGDHYVDAVEAYSGDMQFKVFSYNDLAEAAENDEEVVEAAENDEEVVEEAEESVEVVEGIVLDAIDEEDIPEVVEEPIEDVAEELEELSEEELQISDNSYFAMTQFGANTNNITDLEGINAGSIVENEGVYQIANNLQYTDVIQDPSFKELVDSVLK